MVISKNIKFFFWNDRRDEFQLEFTPMNIGTGMTVK